MALFGLFRSQKNTPAKTSAKTPAKAPAKKPVKTAANRFVKVTADVVNTGVDVYNFPGTPEDFFAQVIARNFPDYEIRRNVDFAQIYDPTGAIRVAAQTPGSTFSTRFHKSVADDMLRGSFPRLTFVICENGQPQVAILLCDKADYDNEYKRNKVNSMGLALRQKNIAFQRYFKEFRNDEAYVRQRIEEDLGW